jgi:hypothetical protein
MKKAITNKNYNNLNYTIIIKIITTPNPNTIIEILSPLKLFKIKKNYNKKNYYY